MTQEKLPNHSYDDSHLPGVEFSSQLVGEIRTAFGFADSYPLEDALHLIAVRFDRPSTYKPPPKKEEQQKLLGAVHKSAVKLEDALRRLGKAELILIAKHDPEWIRATKLEEIWRISDFAEAALKELRESSRPGRPRSDKARDLILRLRKIYEDGTGNFDRFSQVKGTNIYKGDLIKFIEKIVNHIDAPVQNWFIGETLKEYPREHQSY